MEWPGFQSVAPLSEIQFRPPLAFKCHPRQALTEAARDSVIGSTTIRQRSCMELQFSWVAG